MKPVWEERNGTSTHSTANAQLEQNGMELSVTESESAQADLISTKSQTNATVPMEQFSETDIASQQVAQEAKLSMELNACAMPDTIGTAQSVCCA